MSSWYERFREKRGPRRPTNCLFVDDEGVVHANPTDCQDANREARVQRIGANDSTGRHDK
jgi:hypothetical protein